jgi:hypothetical protein
MANFRENSSAAQGAERGEGAHPHTAHRQGGASGRHPATTLPAQPAAPPAAGLIAIG